MIKRKYLLNNKMEEETKNNLEQVKHLIQYNCKGPTYMTAENKYNCDKLIKLYTDLLYKKTEEGYIKYDDSYYNIFPEI